MQSEEQRLIDGLFSRLKQAEAQSAPRDATAEGLIAQHVQAQPAAPYYMAQTILIQEAAIKQLNERLQTLESEVTQLQASKPASGGFLAGLFGGGQPQPQSRVNDPIPGAQHYGRPANPPAGYAAPQAQNYAPGRSGGGFMAGALQTAAGVAGGVVLGNMLMNMFSGTHPQDIVNIIEEPTVPATDDLTQASDAQFLPDDGTDFAATSPNDDWSNADINNDDFSNDDLGGDDDSWV
ncbi:DUF2076 domain-containing protein [Scandinavium lactucae]|uniref:DUF2076 domain-containing protein n=1 Tax=Scandinavium lactucae TaxID=3095028 RepID=A0ABU4QJ45_9ENTR|nr:MULTISPECIES: DUF2076 domain-containing protein [unclassified Scandinavium]MDX6039318.1 DUF2076 domain-containing protein [Scandinavium sp. V105_6]MDX6050389.1 DUF2076 domain-containing protein [Scandinavium sp. V105_1]